MPGLSSVSCPGGGSVVASLAPGASATCTATYTTTAADVTRGRSPTSTVVGTTPKGSSVQSNGGTTVPVAGSPFTCTTPTNFLSQTNSNNSGAPTQLYYSVASTQLSWLPLGPLYPKTYNALGFDSANNYLYAIVTGSKKLLKIDASGATMSTTIPGFSVPGTFPNAGGFDASGQLLGDVRRKQPGL